MPGPFSLAATTSRFRKALIGLLLVFFIEFTAVPRIVAEEPDADAIARAVDKGVAYLKANRSQGADGRATIAALAMVKAEIPVNDPEVRRALDLVQKKVVKGVYTPGNLHEHGYESGLDAMLLEAADREKYKPEIEAIAQYLLRVQHAGGEWNYPTTPVGGDTSITQYGLLGLWAATRAGVRVPTEAWDRAANWLVTTQDASGGFVYHPGSGPGAPQIGMSTAGTASLHLCRSQLFPNADFRGLTSPEGRAPSRLPARRFGVLERVDTRETGKGVAGPQAPKSTGYVARTTIDRIDKGINGGMEWVVENFTIDKAPNFKFYYLYTLERLTAFADLQLIGDHDWYAEGAEHLLKEQGADGSWNSSAGAVPETAFAIMFLVRATNKMMNRKGAPLTVGAGLLAGGRGLPDNLAAVQVKDGKVATRKVQGDLDELLTDLESQKDDPTAAVQKAIVEAVQLGDREKLLGQTDRLLKLASHPKGEVRRTALWALGRSRELRVSSTLVKGLEDSDVDVVVEANNALCYLSRKPQGVGVAMNPLDGLGEEATAAQKTEALEAWRKVALKRWNAWRLSVRPFDERFDLEEPRPSR